MATEDELLAGQVVLGGYGRVGRRIAAAFADAGIPFVVVDQNRELVERCRANDIPAVCGNAAEMSVLIRAMSRRQSPRHRDARFRRRPQDHQHRKADQSSD